MPPACGTGHASGKSIVLMRTITYFLAMDLQVTHLRTLQAIVRHGSFSRAAQALNVTQPAVSMQVRHLERALGLPVRDRELAVTPFFRDELVAISEWGAPKWPPASPGRSAAPRRSRGAPRHPASVDAPTLAKQPLILFEAGATLRRVIDAWFHRA